MEQLCTSCLCEGRKLHYIFDTKFENLYSQIIKEISPFSISSQICIKICWECFSILNRFQSFKLQAQNSYVGLLKHLTESTQPTPKVSTLNVHHIFKISCPEIKPEPIETDDNHCKSEADREINLIEFKDVKYESEESCDVDVMNVDYNDHCEETFVDEISTWTERCKEVEDKQKPKTNINNDIYETDSDSELIPLKEYKKKFTQNNFGYDDNFVQYQSKSSHDEDNELSISNSLNKEDDKEIKLENYIDTDKILKANHSDPTSNNKKVNSLNSDTSVGDIKTAKNKRKPKKPIKNQDYITIELSYEEMQAERQTDKLADAFEDATYKCHSCVNWFRNKQAFDLHFKCKHDPDIGEFKCPVCETFVANFDSFSTHYNKHMKRYECSKCLKRTASVKLMQEHHISSHQIKIKQFKCKHCGKTFDSKDAYRYHLDSHGGRIQCPHCDKTFTHRAGLANHTQSVHKNRNKFPCERCGKIFRWKASLKRHVAQHHEEPSQMEAFCESCEIHFASVSSLQRHLKNSLKHVSQLDLRYVCNDCNRRYADKTKLRNHIEEKHLHKTFYCPICKKPSKNSVGLDQHIRNVHKGRPNNKICHHCGKGFPTRTQLESHIRTHTGERPFICEFCPTTFSQHSNLYKHNRQVHLNIKSKRNVTKKKEENN